MSISQRLLKDKAVLITEPIVSVKTVAIGFWFSIGSRHEFKGKQGITHFVEHMLFKGTTKRSSFSIACEFDKIGGYINAFTERELLCVYCVVPCNYVNKAIKIINEMISDSVFDILEFEKERTVIQSEIISSLDDPEEAAMDAVFSSVWQDNSLALSISGNVNDVDCLLREDLVDWYDKTVKNGFLLITVAGNFDENELIDTVMQFPLRNNFDDKPKVVSPKWQANLDFIPANFQQEQFFLSYPLQFPINYEKSIQLSILNAIIGDTMSSRLFQKLREKSGYCYNVYSFFNTFSDCGFWCAYATSSKSNCLNVTSDLLNVVDNFMQYNLEQDEIDFAKQHLCGEEIMASEDMEQRMKQLSKNFFSGYQQMSSEQVIDSINQVTDEQLFNALKYLKGNNEKSLIVYGPKLSFINKRKIKDFFEMRK